MTKRKLIKIPNSIKVFVYEQSKQFDVKSYKLDVDNMKKCTGLFSKIISLVSRRVNQSAKKCIISTKTVFSL